MRQAWYRSWLAAALLNPWFLYAEEAVNAASQAVQSPEAGMKIHIDPATGQRLAQPVTPVTEPPGVAARVQPQPIYKKYPDGSQSVHFPGGYLIEERVRIDQDGRVIADH